MFNLYRDIYFVYIFMYMKTGWSFIQISQGTVPMYTCCPGIVFSCTPFLSQVSLFLFFKIYFIFGCIGSSLLHVGFL